MLKPVTGALLILIVSCGHPPEQNVRLRSDREPTYKLLADSEDIVSAGDMEEIPDILPTMYYTPFEDKVKCTGGYGRTSYQGGERTNLLGLGGKIIATICTRFARTLLMEGSGILRDRGQGEMVVNFGGKVQGQPRYFFLNRCRFGEGVKKDLCLLPYHTIAADNKHHKVDEILFVPEARGVRLPDGSIHDGYFIVRDTGGAFNGIGSQRVDLFTGTDPDFENAFQRAGFHHRRPMAAYKISGDSATRIREKLRKRFGALY